MPWEMIARVCIREDVNGRSNDHIGDVIYLKKIQWSRIYSHIPRFVLF